MGALPLAFRGLACVLAELALADLYAGEGDLESARLVWGCLNQTAGRPADAPMPEQDWSLYHGDA